MDAIQITETVILGTMLGIVLAEAYLVRIRTKRRDAAMDAIGRRQAELDPTRDPKAVRMLATYRGSRIDTMQDPELISSVEAYDDAAALCRKEHRRCIAVCIAVCLVSTAMSIINCFIGGA